MSSRRPVLRLLDVAQHCLRKPGSKRTRPFGPEPLVFKVADRMFALLGRVGGRDSVTLKCDPERSLVLRTSYPAIVPGYHLNKEHWNTLVLDGSLPALLVEELIDHSYELVNAKRGRKRAPPPRVNRRRSRS